MSAVEVTIAALMAAPAVTDIVGDRITNMVTEDENPLNIVVYLVFEDSTSMLDGPAKWYQARVTVDCASSNPAQIHDIAEAVKDALEPLHLAPLAGCIVSFRKEGTDATDFGEESSSSHRALDFYVDWRRA
jgi:hypothetical protein